MQLAPLHPGAVDLNGYSLADDKARGGAVRGEIQFTHSVKAPGANP
jgi:hypothetical protein